MGEGLWFPHSMYNALEPCGFYFCIDFKEDGSGEDYPREFASDDAQRLIDRLLRKQSPSFNGPVYRYNEFYSNAHTFMLCNSRLGVAVYDDGVYMHVYFCPCLCDNGGQQTMANRDAEIHMRRLAKRLAKYDYKLKVRTNAWIGKDYAP